MAKLILAVALNSNSSLWHFVNDVATKLNFVCAIVCLAAFFLNHLSWSCCQSYSGDFTDFRHFKIKYSYVCCGVLLPAICFLSKLSNRFTILANFYRFCLQTEFFFFSKPTESAFATKLFVEKNNFFPEFIRLFTSSNYNSHRFAADTIILPAFERIFNDNNRFPKKCC